MTYTATKFEVATFVFLPLQQSVRTSLKDRSLNGVHVDYVINTVRKKLGTEGDTQLLKRLEILETRITHLQPGKCVFDLLSHRAS